MDWKATILAEHLGISSNRVHQLANDGLFPKNDDGKFDSIACIRAYIEKKSGKTRTAAEEKERLDKLKADKIQIEIDAMKGELINADIAMEQWSKVIQAERSKLLAIPTKAAPILVGTKSATEVQDILQRLINEVLREISSPDLVKSALGIQSEKRKKAQRRK